MNKICGSKNPSQLLFRWAVDEIEGRVPSGVLGSGRYNDYFVSPVGEMVGQVLRRSLDSPLERPKLVAVYADPQPFWPIQYLLTSSFNLSNSG